MKLPPRSKAVFHLIKIVLASGAVLGLTDLMPVVKIAVAEMRHILLQSTTSTLNSGLYDVLLPTFTKTSGIEVRVVAVGSGRPCAMQPIVMGIWCWLMPLRMKKPLWPKGLGSGIWR